MKIKISFFAIMLILALFLSSSFYALIPLIAALLHEFGHIFAAKARKVNLDKFNIGIFGARLSMNSSLCSYKDEITICAAGPLTNLIFAYLTKLLMIYFQIESPIFNIFIFSSISLAVINLLPIRSFDGGRILYSIISNLSTPQKAEHTVEALSFFLLFTLWCISVYLLLKTSASLSLFIFSSYLFISLFVKSP